MSPNVSSFLVRMSFLLFGVCLSLASILILLREYELSDIKQIAASIERGQFVSNSELEGVQFANRRSCNRSYVRSLVTVSLEIIDRRNRIGDFNGADAARVQASEVIDHGLRCMPTDGNLWLKKALLDTGTDGFSPSVLRSLENSALFAPRESWVVKARLVLCAELASRGIAELSDLARRDLKNWVVGGGDPQFAALLTLNWQLLLEPTYLAAVSGLPQKQRASHEFAMKRLRRTLPKSP
jgi:hypothetical protein